MTSLSFVNVKGQGFRLPSGEIVRSKGGYAGGFSGFLCLFWSNCRAESKRRGGNPCIVSGKQILGGV
jgi:hypothetical protein